MSDRSTSAFASPLNAGIVMILSAALVISIQDVVIKLFSGQMTLWQIFALRGAIVVPALLGYAALSGHLIPTLRAAFSFWSMSRAVFITTTFLAFYAAIPFISLSTAGAANYSAPIFITLFSAFLIGQRIYMQAGIAVLMGFVGVFILLRPGSDAFSLWVLLPVMGAMFYALAHIVTNLHCTGVSLLALALAQSVVMMAAGCVASIVLSVFQPVSLAVATPYIFGQWAEMTPSLWLVLVILSVLAIAAAVLLAGAYQSAPPVTIGTLEYSYLIFVVLWDVLIFGLVPTPLSLAGMALITGAGLLAMRTPTHS